MKILKLAVIVTIGLAVLAALSHVATYSLIPFWLAVAGVLIVIVGALIAGFVWEAWIGE